MPNAEPPPPRTATYPPPTLRALFTYRGNTVAFAGSSRVDMIAPPAVTPRPEKDQTGYWIEVRAADGTLLYHRTLHDPIRVDVEVFSDDSKQTITRVPIAEPRGEFEVLVPDLPAARTFMFWGPPPDARDQGVPSRVLLSLDFDDLRKPRRDGGKPPSRKAPAKKAPRRGSKR
jgi:hypothetical protein